MVMLSLPIHTLSASNTRNDPAEGKAYFKNQNMTAVSILLKDDSALNDLQEKRIRNL